MVLDIIGITLIVAFFIRGWKKGIIVAVFSVLAIVLGVICALKLSNMLSGYLFAKGWASAGWAQLIAYTILFIGVIWLVKLGAKMIEKSAEMLMLGWANRAGGAILYVFIAMFIWSACLWLGSKASVFSQDTVAASKTYTIFEPIAPWVFAHSGTIIPFTKNLVQDVEALFNHIPVPADKH